MANRVIYAIDAEFIDTPTCSALISFAIVGENGYWRYFEFDYPRNELTPWLRENVVPQLRGSPIYTFEDAAHHIKQLVTATGEEPEFWAYYGAYDWYWFCRLFGGFMKMPEGWPMLFKEFAEIKTGILNVAGPEHHALNDARSLMVAMVEHGRA